MERIKLVCKECGYQTEVDADEAHDNCCDCPICQSFGSMRVDNSYPQVDRREGATNADLFREQIRVLGNNKVWSMIEAIKTVKIRVEYRKNFFQAGGQVPAKELII